MTEMQNHGIELEITEEVAEGNYSNLAVISHSTSEFIIDFATLLPGIKKAKVKNRVILTPEHAKRLLLALQENLAKYEKQHGTILDPRGGFIPFVGPGGKA